VRPRREPLCPAELGFGTCATSRTTTNSIVYAGAAIAG
jgi:hypothetical protein